MQSTVEWGLSSGLRIVVILFGILMAIRFASLISNRVLNLIFKKKLNDIEYQKRADTLKSIVNKTASAVLLGIGLMMILAELGINLGPIIAAAGVVGLAVGFGAQKLVEDVIAGFFYFTGRSNTRGRCGEYRGPGRLC